ncbi:MAG: VCBS repeat-containing protein, partial [Bacteroidia bacterium]|nr:VCBS repeat-containing protein [Bacteroidia bacterium]
MAFLRLFLLSVGWAQLSLRSVFPIVKSFSDTLLNPWAGGWQAPQFSTIDVDGDGAQELFVFDRADHTVQVYRLQGGQWRYFPGADTLFPLQKLSAWALLRDFDADGDKDLFTSVLSNIRVFRNIAPPNSPPQWRLAYDTLVSNYAGYSTYLYSGSVDIPAITDVDADGDMDLLVYEVLGALIEWHRNQAQELWGRTDTLAFALQSSCWGHVYESYNYSTNQFAFMPYSCGPGQREQRIQHAGGSLLVIDLNGDGLKDLIVGDDGPPYLIAGFNTGTLQVAHIEPSTAISPYPPSSSLYLPSFPATYYEDVTGDGKPDLICANNSPLAGRDTWSVWMYPNVGRVDSPAWASPVQGWLQNTLLDVGTASHPTLADLNRDGYLDLILTCESFFTDSGPKSRAFLLWGGPNGFVLSDTNWLNLSQYVLRNPIFTVGDVDGNGRTDLLMGTSTGAIWHWEETQPGAADFQLLTQNFAGLSGPPFAAPLLYDYDGDTDMDLIVGGRNGRLSLYRQETGGSFTLVTDFLGQIELRDTVS